MPQEPDPDEMFDESRCYFPEWADRPPAATRLHEADHNSYLAGGYAEEFGYHIRRERPPILPALIGDPERSREWRVQADGLHPGYPECPRPADRGAGGAESATQESPSPGVRTRSAGSASVGHSPSGSGSFSGSEHVLLVDRRGIEQRPGLLRSFTTSWARLKIRLRDHRS